MAKHNPKPKKIISNDPEMLKRIEEMAAAGLNAGQIALVLNISKITLTRRKKECQALDDAITRGRGKAINNVGGKLYQKAINGEPWAVALFMKMMGTAVDRKVVDHTSTDGSMTPQSTNVEVTLSDDKLKARIKKLEEDV